jgi:hypothetical protein
LAPSAPHPCTTPPRAWCEEAGSRTAHGEHDDPFSL